MEFRRGNGQVAQFEKSRYQCDKYGNNRLVAAFPESHDKTVCPEGIKQQTDQNKITRRLFFIIQRFYQFFPGSGQGKHFSPRIG